MAAVGDDGNGGATVDVYADIEFVVDGAVGGNVCVDVCARRLLSTLRSRSMVMVMVISLMLLVVMYMFI